MLAILSALVPLIGGFTQPLKDYFASKAKQGELIQQLEIEKIKAQVEAVKSSNEAASGQLSARLESTSKEFKQNTFYLAIVPAILSCTFPKAAQDIWHNFGLMPEWYQILITTLYAAIWAIPLGKDVYGSLVSSMSNGIASRREYKLEKAKINRAAAFASLKAKWFPKGMTQPQVDDFNAVLDEGEK